MRQTFIKALVELAEKDERIYLLTADMGFGLVEPFSEKFPERFINVGVAENNMIGVATGLALEGKLPFVYSITNFPTLRCLEAIRNNICYHNLPVCIVAGSTGLTYGELGSSHHATEDISVMRSLPNMSVVCPSNRNEVRTFIQMFAGMGNKATPSYLRLGYYKEDEINRNFRGKDSLILTTGSMLTNVKIAALKLEQLGISVTVHHLPVIKPLDSSWIAQLALWFKNVITVEEHSVIGGLGSTIAEILADNGLPIKLHRIGITDCFCNKVGTRDELLKEYHLTPELIAQEVMEVMKNG